MVKFNDKNIFSCDLSAGDIRRKEYLESINKFIDKKYNESFEKRMMVEVILHQLLK